MEIILNVKKHYLDHFPKYVPILENVVGLYSDKAGKVDALWPRNIQYSQNFPLTVLTA